MGELTQWLGRIQQSEPGAREGLFSAAYDELRRLAHARLFDGGRNVCLDTTALVHESYLRFVQSGALRAQERRAFFAYASQVMRSVIVDAVRERQAQRRGGDVVFTAAATAQDLPAQDEPEAHVLAVHEALDSLAAAEPRLAEVAVMRYFGGYTDAEVAEALDLSEATVRRDWQKARVLLRALLEQG